MIPHTTTTLPLMAALLLTLLTLPPLTTAKNLPNRPCRFYRGFSRCVSPPLNIPDKDLWCEYHTCGPSWQRARRCARGNRKATHRCRVRYVYKSVYECLAGRKHKGMLLPVGCKGKKCRPARVCACVKSRPYRYVFVPKRKVNFKCKKGVPVPPGPPGPSGP